MVSFPISPRPTIARVDAILSTETSPLIQPPASRLKFITKFYAELGVRMTKSEIWRRVAVRSIQHRHFWDFYYLL